MADELTAKQQAFAREYMIDRNGKQAAIRVGYSPATAEQQASRLLSNVKVRAFVNQLGSEYAEKAELTVASITERLLTIADKGEKLDGAQGLSVARQSLMDAAKLNGLVVETNESIVRSPEERAARLAKLKAERERLSSIH